MKNKGFSSSGSSVCFFISVTYYELHGLAALRFADFIGLRLGRDKRLSC